MIRYHLQCAQAHEFEAWFASIATFDAQSADGAICCPECGSRDVAKSMMAPHVAAPARKLGESRPAPRMPAELAHILREMHRALTAATEDVGARFAEEARKIHYGEAEERGIRGTASHVEARGLIEEGVAIAVLPPLPEDAN